MVGAELENKLDLGYFTSILLTTLISFSMALNSLLKIGIGDDIKEDLNYEQPHIVFPLFRIMDRVIISKPGEVLPILGEEIPETDIERDKRRNGDIELKFELDRVYTLSFHTSFIDFANWTLCGFPGYSSIDIRTFLGIQSPRIVVYELSPNEIELKNELVDLSPSSSASSLLTSPTSIPLPLTSSYASCPTTTKPLIPISTTLLTNQPFHKNHPINKKKYLANLQIDFFPNTKS